MYSCLYILALIDFVLSDNVTDTYKGWHHNFESRQSRLIKFNRDQGDISVELAFSVPFISIPVKKSMDMATSAIANVNVGAIVLGGTVIFGMVIILPAVITFFTKRMKQQNYKSRSSDPDVWIYLNLLDQILMENNIDTTTCMQRMVCWTVKKSSKKVETGNGTSTDKIIDGLASNEWIQNSLEETTFHDALKNGLSGTNCSKQYDKCKVTQRSLQLLIKKFVKSVNGV